MYFTSSALLAVIGVLACPVLAGCAATSRSAARVDCAGPSPPFSAPVQCPVTGAELAARQRALESGCVHIAREPGPAGGLRIPAQVVCPVGADAPRPKP